MPQMLLFLFVVSVVVALIAAIAYLSLYVIPFVVLGVGTYVAVRKWQTSPETLERRAKAHTHRLYKEAKRTYGKAPDKSEFIKRLFDD